MSISSRLDKLQSSQKVDKANWLKVIYVGRHTTREEYTKMVEEAHQAGARLIMTMPQPAPEDGTEEEEGPDYADIITGKLRDK